MRRSRRAQGHRRGMRSRRAWARRVSRGEDVRHDDAGLARTWATGSGEHECTHAAMESTGVYWKPVWHVLEATNDLVLANAMRCAAAYVITIASYSSSTWRRSRRSNWPCVTWRRAWGRRIRILARFLRLKLVADRWKRLLPSPHRSSLPPITWWRSVPWAHRAALRSTRQGQARQKPDSSLGRPRPARRGEGRVRPTASWVSF